MAQPRITRAVLSIFAALLEDGNTARYGLEIASAAGLSHTTIYDTLARLEAAKWLSSEWEQANPNGAPRRRLYRLTGLGERVAEHAFAHEQRQLSRLPSRLRPRGSFG